MLERRIFMLVAALVVLLASAALWNAFVRPPARASAGATPGPAPAESLARASRPLRPGTARAVAHPAPAPAPTAPPPAAGSPIGAGGPSYLVLLARSEIR